LLTNKHFILYSMLQLNDLALVSDVNDYYTQSAPLALA